MHVQVKRDELLKPLNYVAGVVERRQSLPILSYLLLKADADGISMTGTDLEVEITVNGKATGSGGEMMLPARKLLDICRALAPESELDIRTDGNKAVVKAGRSRFSLLTLPVADFPTLQAASAEASVTLPQAALRALLEQTQFCMAQQDVRYYLNGVLIEVGEGRIRAVATDGHRMAMADHELGSAARGNKQVIIPRKGVHELVRILEDTEAPVDLEIGANHIRVRTPDITFLSKLVDGRYPDYEKVIPGKQTKSLEIEREVIKEALGRVAILSNEKYRGVRLVLAPNSLRISAHNPEQEEAQEEVPIDYRGEELEIGFNVTYLLESLNALRSETVTIELNDPNSSCVLRATGRRSPLYVVMPMRL
jgi:DNA polymerase-3 subunit beta